MLNELSFTAGTPHPQNLHIPFVTITFMDFEMGDTNETLYHMVIRFITFEMVDADEALYHINRMGNGNRFENELANSDLIALFPPANHRR